MSRSPSLGLFLFPQNEEGGLDEYFSQLGPWTSGSNDIWERVRNENSLTPLEACCIRRAGLDPAVCFDAASRGFRCCSSVRTAGPAALVPGLSPGLFPPIGHPLPRHRWMRCVVNTETSPPLPGRLPPTCPLTPAPMTSPAEMAPGGPPASSAGRGSQVPSAPPAPAPPAWPLWTVRSLVCRSVSPAKWWDQRGGAGLVPPWSPSTQHIAGLSFPTAPQAVLPRPSRPHRAPIPPRSLQAPTTPTAASRSFPLANVASRRPLYPGPGDLTYTQPGSPS